MTYNVSSGTLKHTQLSSIMTLFLKHNSHFLSFTWCCRRMSDDFQHASWYQCFWAVTSWWSRVWRMVPYISLSVDADLQWTLHICWRRFSLISVVVTCCSVNARRSWDGKWRWKVATDCHASDHNAVLETCIYQGPNLQRILWMMSFISFRKFVISLS